MSRIRGCAGLPLVALLCAICSPPVVAAAPAHTYDQADATLGAQLAEVAAIHRVNLIYPDARIGLQPAPGLHGRFDLSGALDRLLTPLGLRWRQVADGSIHIEAAAPVLRVQVGTVDIRARRVPAPDAPRPDSEDRVPGEPDLLLAQRTAAGWSFAAPALRILPDTDLGRWLSRSPNAYGQGSQLSLRGIQRDSFAAQTSTVRLSGLPLSASALDAGLPLPSALARMDYALGPQPESVGSPGFAGALSISGALPVPQNDGLLRLAAGGRNERRWEVQQSLDLQQAGAAQVVWVDRQRDGSVLHADGRPRAHDQLGLLRWLYEPDAQPALTVSADLLWIDARPADTRLTPPLVAANFDPTRRTDQEPARALDLKERGARLGARWDAAEWILTLEHLGKDSRSQQQTPGLLDGAQSQDSDERVQTHQWAASRSHPGSPLQLRIALDHATREARFSTRDELPLTALYPAAGSFQVSDGASRSLRTSVDQQIRSSGGQLWLGFAWTHVQLEAGGAWTHERRRERDTLQRTVSPGCFLIDRSGARLDCRTQQPDLWRQTEAQSRERYFTPAVTALFRSASWGQFGLQWRRGVRSGGVRPFAGQAVPFRPERSDTFEFSVRGPEWKGTTSRLAVFHNAWRDRQVQLLDPDSPGFAIVNAGRARAAGAELTLGTTFADDWLLGLGIGVLRTRFDRFQLPGPGAPVDLAGKAFPGAPRRTAVLSLGRAPAQGLELGVLVQAASRAEGDAFNRRSAQLAGRAELDLRIGWRSRGYSVGLEALNALDRTSYEQIQVSAVADQPRSYQLGAPRQIRATVEWRW